MKCQKMQRNPYSLDTRKRGRVALEESNCSYDHVVDRSRIFSLNVKAGSVTFTRQRDKNDKVERKMNEVLQEVTLLRLSMKSISRIR